MNEFVLISLSLINFLSMCFLSQSLFWRLRIHQWTTKERNSLTSWRIGLESRRQTLRVKLTDEVVRDSYQYWEENKPRVRASTCYSKWSGQERPPWGGDIWAATWTEPKSPITYFIHPSNKHLLCTSCTEGIVFGCWEAQRRIISGYRPRGDLVKQRNNSTTLFRQIII